MGLREVNRVRRRALGILCACFILLALGYLEAAWIDYYFFPCITATTDKVYLTYRRNPQIDMRPSSYLHTSADGVNWSQARHLPLDPGCAQVIGDTFYVVRGDHYSLFDLDSVLGGENVSWRRSGSFDLDWQVVFALPEGENLRLLGVEDDGEGDKVRIREAVLGDSSTKELSHSLEIDRPGLVSACLAEHTLYFLHRAPQEKEARLLRRERGAGWEDLGQLPGDLVLFDCACAAGSLHIVGTPVRRGEAGNQRLVHYTLSEQGSVQGTRELQHNITNFFGRLREVSEVSVAGSAGRLYLAGRFGKVVATSVWHDGTWSGFVTVNKVPLATTILMWGWLFSVLALCGALVVVGFQLYFARRARVASKPGPEAVSVEPVGILRRGGAFAVDLMVVGMIIISVAGPVMGDSGNRTLLDFVNLQHPLILRLIVLAYFVVAEGVFGQTIGKRLFGIVVRAETGRRAGIWNVVLRNLFKLIEILLVIEVFVLLSTAKFRRLGDLVSGTVVVVKK